MDRNFNKYIPALRYEWLTPLYDPVMHLVFHHLTRENKDRTFKEIFRVLKPGGEMFQKAGFEQVEETVRFMTIFGTLSLYRAKKP